MATKRYTVQFAVLAALACVFPRALDAAPSAAPAAASAARLYYANNAMVEIVSRGGVRVLIDVFDPALLSSPATGKDILLTTHEHGDHINAPFLRAFKGQQLYVRAGTLSQGDVKVTGIPSSHGEDEISGPKDGTNYLFLVETGGLRIVHMGDVGQAKLTASQMQTLGKIDVMITQFDNLHSNMDVYNGKGFKLVAQIDPALIVPTHNGYEALQTEAAEYSCVFTKKAFASLDPAKLRAERKAAGRPLMLLIGPDAETNADTCKAKPVTW